MNRLLARARRALMSQADRDAQESILVNQGRILAGLNAGRSEGDLADFEFKIFSQFGEDGIIQHIVSHIPTINPTFVEFGVETFSESNCRFLMTKDRWSGVVLDGSPANVAAIRASSWFWKHQLTAVCAFITRENISALLADAGAERDCGLLSLDIDGVDYHVLEALADWRPQVLIVEYNPLFGPDAAVTVPYDPAFERYRRHPSGSYFGASLKAFADLCERRGYVVLGTSAAGVNAFFVRRELLWPGARALSAQQAWRPPGFRQGRNPDGSLACLSLAEERNQIGRLPLTDLASGACTNLVELGLAQ